jgi:hypothetical protein
MRQVALPYTSLTPAFCNSHADTHFPQTMMSCRQTRTTICSMSSLESLRRRDARSTVVRLANLFLLFTESTHKAHFNLCMVYQDKITSSFLVHSTVQNCSPIHNSRFLSQPTRRPTIITIFQEDLHKHKSMVWRLPSEAGLAHRRAGCTTMTWCLAT